MDASGAIRVVEPTSGRDVFRVTGPEPIRYSPECFSPDGTHLIAACENAICDWDLRLIRTELKKMGLDWDWPEFLPTPTEETTGPTQTVEVDPGFLRAPYLKEDRQALAVYGLCLALQPLNPEAFLQRGLAHARLGYAGAAIADYNGFIAMAPSNHSRFAEALCRRADCYENLEDHAGLAGALQETLGLDPKQLPWPDRIALQYNNVVWHFVIRAHQETYPSNLLALAKKAVQMEPYSWEYQNTLGAAFYRLGQWQNAVSCLQQNLKNARDLASWDLYFLAMSYQRLEQPERARQCFHEAGAYSQGHTNSTIEQTRELADLRSEATAVLGIVSAASPR
jgi:hypothetical protein